MAEGHRSLTLTATEVADAPLLGYRLINTGEINPALADRAVTRRLTQPWVTRGEADGVLLDVALLGALSPLGDLFVWHPEPPRTSASEGGPAGSTVTFRGTCRLNPDDVVPVDAELVLEWSSRAVEVLGSDVLVRLVGFLASGFTMDGYHRHVDGVHLLRRLHRLLPEEVQDRYFGNYQNLHLAAQHDQAARSNVLGRR